MRASTKLFPAAYFSPETTPELFRNSNRRWRVETADPFIDIGSIALQSVSRNDPP
jgi:hypothetical protein